MTNDREEWLRQNGVYEVFELRQQLQEAQQIDCPACGETVTQVASATLSLALSQHWRWVCPKAKELQEAQQERARIETVAQMCGMDADRWAEKFRTAEAQCASQAEQLKAIDAAIQTLYGAYQEIPCDTYVPERTQDGWLECRHCSQSERTHQVFDAVRAVLSALNAISPSLLNTPKQNLPVKEAIALTVGDVQGWLSSYNTLEAQCATQREQLEKLLDHWRCESSITYDNPAGSMLDSCIRDLQAIIGEKK